MNHGVKGEDILLTDDLKAAFLEIMKEKSNFQRSSTEFFG